MPGVLTFDPTSHEYRFEGQQIPSVSQALKAAGLVDYSRVPQDGRLEYAADRGTKVHRACELWDNDDLYLPTLPRELVPYVTAWKHFRQARGFRIMANEQRYCGDLHGLKFGMTLDRLVKFDPNETLRPERLTVLDIKTSANNEKWHAIQLAGYAIGLEPSGTPAKRLSLYRRLIVQLRNDATYSLYECDNLDDGEVFAAALKIAWWRGPKAWASEVPEVPKGARLEENFLGAHPL